jgi:putative flavoprotein involved in K+ transport
VPRGLRQAVERGVPVAIVGGGQAGLAMSWCLKRQGIEHVVLERESVGHAWRTARWDTFCLVTPNWQCRLPGYPYTGPDPDGFMPREQIVQYLQGYAASFDPPLHEGVSVEVLRQNDSGGFDLDLSISGGDGSDGDRSIGTLTATQVVLATGGYQEQAVPPMAATLPPELVQIASSAYRGPDQLPEGAVLVVGSGQSGAQVAEDLHLAGRRVHLCVGSAPRCARTYRGRDVVAWLEDMGHYSTPIEQHPRGEAARHGTNHYVTGRDGGHDIDLRVFALQGMALHGRLLGAADGRLSVGTNLARDLDGADAVSEGIKDGIDRWIERHGLDAPAEDRYVPVWRPPAEPATEVDLRDAGITSVVWCTGFRADWSWVRVPAFDGRGYPSHSRGVTSVPGLHVLGLPWLHTWGSGRFAGVAVDAEHLAGVVARQLAASRSPADLAG